MIMKITTKTTKEQLKTFLAKNALAVKETDKDLFDRLVYADKMCKTDDSKVQKADLVALVKEVMKVLGDKCVEPKSSKEEKTPVETPVKTEETPSETTEAPTEPKAENSVKKLSKKSKTSSKTSDKATESKAEEPKTVAEEKPVEEKKVDSKKPAKKSLSKKKEETPKDDSVVESSEEKTTPNMFPETLDVDGEEFKLAHEITSMDDLYDAISNGDRILFAFYWSRKLLKQFPYFNHMLGKPTSFKNDLDLANTIYVSDKKRIAYHTSIYTEGCYNTLPEDFEEVDGIRYAGATEFQIYKSTATI